MIQLQALKSENIEKANETYLPPRRKGNSLVCTAQLMFCLVFFALANRAGPLSFSCLVFFCFGKPNQIHKRNQNVPNRICYFWRGCF